MFGEWLRQQRELRRLTREEFAERIGCSVSALRKIEDGERRPSAQIAELIANCLDIPSAEHVTFIKVARGDLNVERLLPPSNLNRVPRPNISSPKTNLPILPTPLIGRQGEVEKLSGLLRDPQCRLLTLVGPGGIGKTRLAIETASHMQEVFADGVYFIPLAPVNSIRYVVPVIADALGFAFQSAGSDDPKTQLFNFLKEKQVLFLADNLEHLLTEPGIEMLAELLSSAPQIKLLATSRESLDLQGEWIFEVHGLPVPEDDHTEGTSIELFIQRARRAHVEFNAAPEDFHAILHICQLVDGMPLAIELAAAWIRTLTCDEIAKEIERGLDFLSVSTRALPARHRSMRAVFDHSWRLLTEEEQQVLARLSVFRGGFQRQAAEQVAGANLPILSALMTKSLVRRSGDYRYDLHELIRQYTADRLADQAKAWQEAHKSHAIYYLEYFTSRNAPLRSYVQRETLTELTVEMDNLRAAWEWAVTSGDLARLCQASPTLWYLFELRTWLADGEMIFHNTAERIQSSTTEAQSGSDALVAINTMRAHAAYFGFRLGKSVASYAVLLPSVRYLQSGADRIAAIYSSWYLGIVCWELGKYTEGVEILQASWDEARARGERWYEAVAGEFTGIIAHDQGRYDQARRYLTQALDIAREMRDPMLTAHILNYMSPTIEALGKFSDARKILQESLELAQKVGYRPGVGHALGGLGRLAQMTDPYEARTFFAASCDVYKEIGDLRNSARALNQQGYNSLVLGNDADAQDLFLVVLRLSREGGYMPIALNALLGIANLQTKRGNKEAALELLLLILNHPATTQETRARAEHLRAALEAQLPPSQIDSIQRHAGKRTFESVVEALLK